MPSIDRVGSRFGRLLVISRGPNNKSNHPKWVCRCDCGNVKTIDYSSLSRGMSTSCGCWAKEDLSKRRVQDFTGRKIGKLTVVRRDFESQTGDKARWLCKCDCGGEIIVPSNILVNGAKTACGCVERDHSKTTLKDLVGLKFGLLDVIERCDQGSSKHAKWRCRCACGNLLEAFGCRLERGSLNSCGCILISKYIGRRIGTLVVVAKHENPQTWISKCDCGEIRTITTSEIKNELIMACGRNCALKPPEFPGSANYGRWRHMICRCTDKSSHAYKDYGGRGITVCERWMSFGNFIEDMGEPPTKLHTLDRRDNNQGYSKENCRWATKAEQNRNTRRNIIIEYQGRKQCLKDWATELKTTSEIIKNKMKRGISFEKVFEDLSNANKAR